VVIVNWNAGDLLAESLSSVYASDLPDTPEVVVIDNHSTDGSLLRLQERFPALRLIRNQENRGFARANNQGILASTGEYILQLNPDAFLAPDTLRVMADFLEATPDAGAVAPLLFDGEGRRVPLGASPGLARMLLSDTIAAKLFPSLVESPTSFPTAVTLTRILSGSCLLLRRQALREAGLVNERLFLYFEEADLLERFSRRGWRAYYLPHTSAVHLGERSTALLPHSEKLLLYKQSAFQLWRSRYGAWGALALRALQFPLVLLTLLLVSLRGLGRRRETDAVQIRFYLAFLRLLLGLWRRSGDSGPLDGPPRGGAHPAPPSPPSA